MVCIFFENRQLKAFPDEKCIMTPSWPHLESWQYRYQGQGGPMISQILAYHMVCRKDFVKNIIRNSEERAISDLQKEKDNLELRS